MRPAVEPDGVWSLVTPQGTIAVGRHDAARPGLCFMEGLRPSNSAGMAALLAGRMTWTEEFQPPLTISKFERLIAEVTDRYATPHRVSLSTEDHQAISAEWAKVMELAVRA